MNGNITTFTRDQLHDRHRLSHQQIDHLLGENRCKEFVHEKLKQLDAVKNFLSVTDLLSQNGISFVCLKGQLLSYRIYGDPTVRVTHDIDILIETIEIEHVIEILFKNGYQLTAGFNWPKKRVQQEMILTSQQHLSFHHTKSNFYVEVHWIIIQGVPISVKMQQEIIAANLTEINFAGRKFTTLTKEFELLFLIIHGARHGWNRLKWLIDINEYPVKEIDEVIFLRLVGQLKAERIVGQVNYLLNEFFNTKFPFKGDDHYHPYLNHYALQAIDNEIHILHSIREYICKYRYEWLMFPGLYHKFKTISRVMYRPPDIALIDSSFKIVYFIYRPYGLIKRRLFHA